jgi:hypothetical protein
MAVIVRRTIRFGDEQIESKVYEPSGVISKDDRLRAERLDHFLETRIPAIADEVVEEVPDDSDSIRRWHTLGRKLRAIVDDRNLVLQSDIDNMLIWQAIWQFLPVSMKPSRTNRERPYPDKQHKRQDHLSLCYELANYSWDEITWIQRWTDVHEITARPSLLRDKRIFNALGKKVGRLPDYPSIDGFREIMKRLAKAFPTRQYRDSLMLDDEEVESRVSRAVEDSLSI